MSKKYIVAFATNNTNEDELDSPDSLNAGVFRQVYDTAESAYHAIRGEILQEAIDEIADSDGVYEEDADQLAESWIFFDSPTLVRETHNEMVCVYVVKEIEV